MYRSSARAAGLIASSGNLIAGERLTGARIDRAASRRCAKLPARIASRRHRRVLIEQLVAAIAAVGHREVRLAGAVVDAGDLQRAADRAAEILPGVRRASRARVGAQLIRSGVERRAAEGVVRGGVVGVLPAAPAADHEITAAATARRGRRVRPGPPGPPRPPGPPGPPRPPGPPPAGVTWSARNAETRRQLASRPDRIHRGPSPRTALPACRGRGSRYCR